MSEDSPNPAASGGDVFVSYASQDVAIADAIVATSEKSGIKCWIAPRDVTPGSQYADEIVGAINDARVLVLVLSQHAVASPHVGREIERAASKRRRVIALRTDAAALTRSFEYFLSESQWIDAAALGMPAALAKLTQAVGQTLAAPLGVGPASGTGVAAPASPVTKRPVGVRRIALGTVTLIALVFAVAMGVHFWPAKHDNAQAPAVAAASDKSIAVLPFTDMSEKKDQEYFADGLSEELIDLLAKVPDLHVPARTSSFYFKGMRTQLPEIAKALNVANVLEGSVRRSGSALRITAHMIRVESGYEVWSQSYDRDFKDIFQIQDEIAAAVVQALKLQLLSGSAPAYRTANTEAYSLFLQGIHLNSQDSEEDVRRAIKFLQRAVTLDPDYASAWAALAECYVGLAENVGGHPEHDLDAARAAIKKALALNPADAATHYLLATVKGVFEHDWDGAAAEIEAARRIDPSLTEPIELVFATGCDPTCLDQYIRKLSRDIERDPLSATAFDTRGMAHFLADELEAAESDVRRALELSPNALVVGEDLVAILVERHRATEALIVVEAMRDSYYRRARLPLVYQAMGRTDEATVALQTAIATDSEVAPYEIAEMLAFRGDKKSALDWLERDYDLRLNGIVFARMDPLLKSLAREPRFIALMKKISPRQQQ